MHSRLMTCLVLFALGAACAEARLPIDRTQPNKLAKTLFDGEWYFQQTVVEIPGTISPTFVGETNFMSDRVFLDTNIFVYAIDSAPSQGDKRDRARELIREHLEAESGVVSIQVFQEFFAASTG